MVKDFGNKLEALRAVVEKEQKDEARLKGYLAFLDNIKARLTPGRKYTKLDVTLTNGQWTGKYMVENTTGNIYGIKGYGQVHKGHWYGNVDEIADYHWGRYYPVKKEA